MMLWESLLGVDERIHHLLTLEYVYGQLSRVSGDFTPPHRRLDMTFLIAAAVAGKYLSTGYLSGVDPHVVYYLSLYQLLHA